MNFILILSILASITTSYCESIENEVTGLEQSLEANTSMPSILDATASKLVRYRIKAPPSYYRYKTQEYKRPRPRIKIQKPKFSPPSYSYPESGSYYKTQPEIYSSTQSYKPSYAYDEIHYEVSSEYPNVESIPLSSYEAQAMDLDFYEDSFPKKKTPHYEYPKPQKTHTTNRPHKVYGLPKEVVQSSYESYPKNEYKTQYTSKPVNHYDESYRPEPPKENYGRPPHQKEEYEQYPPYGAPPEVNHQTVEISFHVPESEYKAPVTSYHPKEGGQYPLPEVSSYHPQEQPSKGGPYPVYDKKLPNAGYTYNNHFAEPPTDIHITYSPSYEINPLPPKYKTPQNSYDPPPSGNYGPPDEGYRPSDPTDSYHQSSGGHFAEPPESYLPPKHQQDELPLVKNHMPPGYDYPKSSYEVPIYDAIPFEQNTPDHDYFPPNHNTRAHQHEHASESIANVQQVSPQNHPPDPLSTIATTSATTRALEPVSVANKKVHRFIPNKHRTAHRHESTPKTADETESTQSHAPSSNYLDKFHSTTSTFRPRRKRKRTKAPVTEKHHLDVPELQKAFEYGHDQSEEPTASSSNVKEHVNSVKQKTQDTPPVQVLTAFTPSQSWNPMRIRTKQTIPPRGQRTAEAALNELKNIEVVSIEKSHSHSYYAGTVPQRTRNLKSRADAAKMGTLRTTTFKAEDAIQPTRSLVIDQTYFKVKGDDADFYDGTGNLPKNHKLF